MQEPLLFYRCVFDELAWQRSHYGHAATKGLLQGFLDRYLCLAAQLQVGASSRSSSIVTLVCSFLS